MQLIVGGSHQRKLEFALEQYHVSHQVELGDVRVDDMGSVSSQPTVVDENYRELCEVMQAPILNHFHLIVRRWMMEGQELIPLVDQLIDKNSDTIIVTDEIGYGIVPMEAFEREYREQTGRLCCRIASNAVQVYRVVCGIPVRIKG
ncbi:MAG TPA: bifunctional adenosylcobinamide kinase/adenosylcobinamide-phosphate guanylyltransferase [Lachnospiraceae bacterium]|nr:bifunctional adenosylcobinamide kinase/adenosylcobinamide-phosphate guanylyltransferase [Lachnospiraceae bacterium]HEX3076225.1 bifunctional adenosylcobinamide kinase/adenosylcobinamide-phosphate guanylyltransferase [Lachnospiraceae bacterium]